MVGVPRASVHYEGVHAIGEHAELAVGISDGADCCLASVSLLQVNDCTH